MNSEFEDRSQPELFEDYKKAPLKKFRFKAQAFFSKPRSSIAISYENFVFLLIGFVLFGIVSFSLGVEKGKGLNRKQETSLPQKEEKAEKIVIGKTKLYTIQVGSFKKLEAAEKEAVRLKSSGYEVYVFQSGDYFRVCIGSFSDRKEANKFIVSLKKKFSDCIVTNR